MKAIYTYRKISSLRVLAALLAATACIGIASCTKSEDTAATAQEITRLDRAVYSYKNLDSTSRHQLRDSLHAPLTALCKVLELDTLNDTTLGLWSTSLPVDIFSPMTDSAFRDLKDLELQLGTALTRLKDQGLTFPDYDYVAVAWGRQQSVVFVDSVALIALNHYLGVNSPAYEDWPLYRRAMKRPDMMVYDLVEAIIAVNYPYTAAEGKDNVLSRMLYEGVMAEIKMRVVPDACLHKALAFTEAQLSDIEANKELIWNKLVANKMLYSTDPELQDRLFSLLPYSTPISAKAPGRTVRYQGYDILRSYLKRHNSPELSLEQLLSPDFYCNPATLTEAAYQPK